jgi:TatA/E family protein of Tat protein translocase
MFGTLGGPEVILILVVALIVFGPRRLPEIGKSMGKMLAEFRKASNDFKRTIEDELEAEKSRESQPAPPPAPEAAAPVTDVTATDVTATAGTPSTPAEAAATEGTAAPVAPDTAASPPPTSPETSGTPEPGPRLERPAETVVSRGRSDES